MKKRILSAALSVLAFSMTTKAGTISPDEQSSLLWEISGNGLEQSSYLLGTFHMMCEKDFQMKPKIKDALAHSEKLYLEIDYSDAKEMKAMQDMMMSDRKLSESLTETQATELNEILKSYNLSLDAVDNYTEQALFSLIGQKAIPCPAEQVKMFEVELIKLALQNGKTLAGLETVADQIRFLGNAYSLEESIRQLKNGDKYAVMFEKMIAAFNAENLSLLDQLLKNREFMNEEAEKWMLTERNKNWAAKIPAIMEKERTFFAVGSGHLMGEHGLIRLLREKGFTVRPVLN